MTLLRFDRLQADQTTGGRAITREQNQLSKTLEALNSRRRLLEESYEDRAEKWAFEGGGERVLQYALARFSEDGFLRNEFFRRFSWCFRENSASVYSSLTKRYNELITPEVEGFVQPDEQLMGGQVVQPLSGNGGAKQKRRTINNQRVTEEAKVGSNNGEQVPTREQENGSYLIRRLERNEKG